jgi:hypothetical protein
MKEEQKQPKPKQTKKDELLDLAFEQKEEATTTQDSPRETTPRTLRVNTEQEKQTIHVTIQNN